MKTFVIDPFARTVSETDIGDGLDPIYRAISTPDNRVGTFEVFGSPYLTDVELYVDEEGLFVDRDKQRAFAIDGYIMSGKALVFGPADNEGNKTPAPGTAEDMAARIDWDVPVPMPRKPVIYSW